MRSNNEGRKDTEKDVKGDEEFRESDGTGTSCLFACLLVKASASALAVLP